MFIFTFYFQVTSPEPDCKIRIQKPYFRCLGCFFVGWVFFGGFRFFVLLFLHMKLN